MMEEVGRELTIDLKAEARLLAVAKQPLKDVLITIQNTGMRAEEVFSIRVENIKGLNARYLAVQNSPGGEPTRRTWIVHSLPGCMPVDLTAQAHTFIQGEGKRCSPVDLGFGPYASAVLSDDALHRGEPHPGAFKLFVAVKPLKCSKQFFGVLGVESGAVVPNEKHKLAVDCRLVNFNDRALTAAGIFDGIGQKVREHLLDQSGVAID
jgi:hypothetical protein